jgi:hypothetical protein
MRENARHPARFVRGNALRVILPCAIAILTLAGWGAPARADVLISDTFDTLASGANLNGRTPPINNGKAWVATTATFTGNGAGGLNADTLQNKSASIDLGAGYLSSTPGIYAISADLTLPAGGTGLSGIGIGFADANSVDTNFFFNHGEPWLEYFPTGQVNFIGGPGVNGGIATAHAEIGSAHNVKLELDTTKSSWTLNAFLDGAQVDLNSDVGLKSFYYASNANPTPAHYVGLATLAAGAGGGIATVDNFQVTGPLPEPGSALVILAGLAITATRRRRR